MNTYLITEFKKYVELEKLKENKFKYQQLNKALRVLEKIDFEINLENINKLNKIKGIGKGTIDRIINILNGKTIPQTVIKEPEWSELIKIHGIGYETAKELYDKYKYKSIKDIRENPMNVKFKTDILICIKYFEDFQERIPFEEIKIIDKYLQNFLIINKNINGQICGSFRRCQKTCGDIDILITGEFNNFIKYLKKMDIIIDDITPKAVKKYMGVCRLDKLARRIDIRLVSKDEYAPALLYFTGSFQFNICMRNHAISKNMKLNEYGLWSPIGKKTIGIRVKKEVVEWKKIYCETEEEIFKQLEIDYVEPQFR